MVAMITVVTMFRNSFFLLETVVSLRTISSSETSLFVNSHSCTSRVYEFTLLYVPFP